MTSRVRVKFYIYFLGYFNKESSKRLEEFLRDQRGYQDSHQRCRQWLESTKERLDTCNNVVGDMTVIQNKLDTVKVSVCLVETLVIGIYNKMESESLNVKYIGFPSVFCEV